MRVKITGFIFLAFLCFSLSPAGLAQERGYFPQMGQAFTRGLKNIVSSPWEIPSTIRRYDQKSDGNPRVFRDATGFVDGSFRVLTRLGGGVWDVLFSVVPGEQDGLPLTPETFF